MLPSGYNIYKFFKNTKGLNTRDTATGAPENSSSDLLNVDLTTTGAIRKRRGYTLVTDSGNGDPVGIINFKRSSDNTLKAVMVNGSSIFKMDDYDGTCDDITGAVSLSVNKDYLQSMCISRDTVIGTNYYDVPWKYTGTGNASVLSITEFQKAKFVFQFKNRLCWLNTIEGGLNYVNRLRWSNTNTIESYSSLDFSDSCETADGSEITGYVKFSDDVYIFKNSRSNGIKKLYYTGDATSPFSILNISGMGTISPKSIVQVEINGGGSGLLYYGMDNKIYFFDGSVSVPISDHIQSFLDTMTLRPKSIVAENFRELNQIWFGYSNSSDPYNLNVLVYDYYNNAFFPFDGIDCDMLGVLEDTNSVQHLISISHAGKIYQLNTGNSDTNPNGDTFAINSYYWTAWLDLGDASLVKKLRWLDLYVGEVGNYSLTVSWSFNLQDGEQFTSNVLLSAGSGGTFPFVLDSDLLGGSAIKIYRLPMVGIGRERLIRIKYANNGIDEPFTLYRFDIHAKYMGQKSIV